PDGREGRLGGTVGDGEAAAGGVAGEGVLVVVGGVAPLGQAETAPAQRGGSRGHGQRTPWATRVPMSRKRTTETRSALNTKPRVPGMPEKTSARAASKRRGGNWLDMRKSNLAKLSGMPASLPGNSIGAA